jgi:1,4-dihydroxy-6-naphthoate synthase
VTLTLAHSADADDVFMWWPITGKVDPAAPSRVLSPPVIDTGGFVFRSLPADIQVLNRRAVEAADVEITAISLFNYTLVKGRYALTACGWSFGDGFGPKLVVRRERAALVRGALAKDGAPGRPRTIAVPGLQTTAFLTLSLLLGPGTFEARAMPFDRIVGAVAGGEVEAGLLIHESQLDHHLHGLETVADMGAWWKGATGLPLPLGGNVVRRDLEARHGPGTLRRVAATLEASIRYALAHRAESMAYARTFSPVLSDADLERYITMYVSPRTVEAGEEGLRAAEALLGRGAAAGLCPDPGVIDLVRGGGG